MLKKRVIIFSGIISLIVLIIAFKYFIQRITYPTIQNIAYNEIEDENSIETTVREEDQEMPELKIGIGNEEYTAILENNETVRELLKRLPITIQMNELHGNEKYYYWDTNFPTNSQKIENIKQGELFLYGSDCMVLFYENVSNSFSYTRLGYMENPDGLKEVVGKGDIMVKLEIE